MGRYAICADPSRSGVDSHGNVWVACRADGGVAKIAGNPAACVDKNEDGVIQTATDVDGDGQIAASEILPAGTDECVLFTVYPGGATQRAVAIDRWDHAWVGEWYGKVLRRLDREDGATEDEIGIPTRPYGVAIDREGNLWVSGRDGNDLVRVDPHNKKVDTFVPGPELPCFDPYGIAVDFEGNVWLGNWLCSPVIFSFDPEAETWSTVDVGCVTRGIAATSGGRIYAACDIESKIAVVDADAGALIAHWDLGLAGVKSKNPIGLDVGMDGTLWTANYTTGTVIRVDATSGQILSELPIGTQPYAYSDLTGRIHHELVAPVGRHNLHFSSDAQTPLVWKSLFVDFATDDPENCHARVRARAADTQEELQDSKWKTVAYVKESGLIERDLLKRGWKTRLLEVRVELHAHSPNCTPVLDSVRIHYLDAPQYPEHCLGAALPSLADDCDGGQAACCDEQGRLVYCDQGSLYCVDCPAKSPDCGWNALLDAYSCGTGGMADPEGFQSLQCTACAPPCQDGHVCSGGQCVSCVSDCTDRVCGSDGCSGTCGECACGETCEGGQCAFHGCDGKDCGPDGCGGTCGVCGCGETCDEGECTFHACDGRECGWDGCGGSCGVCPYAGQVCFQGLCECTPDCTDKMCGQDGCGGSCGDCPTGALCFNGVCLPGVFDGFVLAPAGDFMMGSPVGEMCRQGDETQHSVTLTHSFFIKTTEVTQSEFEAIMGFNPSLFSNCGPDCPVDSACYVEQAHFCNKLSLMMGLEPCYELDPDNMDYQTVSWPKGYECKGYRLPTEAEWEYAARAGTTTPYYVGNNSDCNCADPLLDPASWYCGNGDSTTHPVGQKQPNAWGLYDMAGNVFERCWDWYAPVSPEAVVDPMGPATGKYKVNRGGSFYFYAADSRSAFRKSDSPHDCSEFIGFRVVRTK